MKRIVCCLVWLLSAKAASAQDRRITPIAIQRKQALIVGNSTYPTAPLKNPANDATAMDAALRQLGFEVRTLRNLDLPHMEAAIDDFTAGLASGSLAFFYYSGHGIQVNYTNYLLPVDFAASSEIDVKYKAYPATRVQEKMEASGARLRVLVLDACRNNPFRFKRDAAAGLASMQVDAEGTLIAFATGDNNTADDNRAESNGLYTKYLIPALESPGLTLRDAFQKAKEQVYAASHKEQNPSIYENVVGTYYLVSAPQGPAAIAPNLPAADAEAWQAIRASNDAKLFEQFLSEYPSSQYSGAARLKLASLRPPVTAPPMAPVVEPGNRAGATKVNPKDGLTYVWIPPGAFTMGCSVGDRTCLTNEQPPQPTRITRGFWIGQTETPQEAYERVMGGNPSYFRGPGLPVETVTWSQSRQYCTTVGMDLPTEAQWEYAARAGDSQPRYGQLGAVAWYYGHSESKTHRVGAKVPNSWGLYDTLGNVYEWVLDWEGGAYSESPQTDPAGPSSGRNRAARGGSWFDGVPRVVRVSFRGGANPDKGVNYIGFRCAGN